MRTAPSSSSVPTGASGRRVPVREVASAQRVPCARGRPLLINDDYYGWCCIGGAALVNIMPWSIYELHLAALARRLVEMEEERDISSSTWPPRWKKQQVTQQRIYGRRLLDALRATPEHHARARRPTRSCRRRRAESCFCSCIAVRGLDTYVLGLLLLLQL